MKKQNINIFDENEEKRIYSYSYLFRMKKQDIFIFT